MNQDLICFHNRSAEEAGEDQLLIRKGAHLEQKEKIGQRYSQDCVVSVSGAYFDEPVHGGHLYLVFPESDPGGQ